MQFRTFVAAVGVAACLAPACGWAQGGTGSIAGNVKDTTGGALPGVTVEVASPALIEKTRSAVTDGQGNYKITELRPGVYSVSFTIAGFSVVKRDGIELSTGFTAPVNAELKVGSVEETITVKGAAPIVDVQSVRTQTVLKAEVMDALPSGQRDIAQLASLTLGAVSATAGRNDVGGDKSEQATSVSIHGSRADDAKIMYDGMNANNPGGAFGGQSRIYKLNTVMVAEQVVDTGGNSAETETSGANINMVPKEGGNKLSLFGMANYTTQRLASSKVPSDLIARGSAPNQNSMKQVWDYGVGVGGPIKEDKIWFYAGGRVWGSQGYAANNYFNKAATFSTYVPDTSRPVYADTYQRDFGGRVTWQVTSKQKFAIEQHREAACGCWQGIAATSAPESTFSFLYTPTYFTQATWTYPSTNRLLFQGGLSYLNQQVQFRSFGGANLPGAITISDSNFPGVGAYTWGGLPGSTRSDNGDPQEADNVSYRYAASYITGSHALKLGGSGIRGIFNTRGKIPAPGITLSFTGGVPTSLTQWATPFKTDGRVINLGLYASDQWTINRLTLTLGARYDHANATALPVDVPAGPFLPAQHYNGVKGLPNFSDITARAGAAFDMFGNGKTALRGSWGRYLVGVGGSGLTTLSPSVGIVTNTSRPWNDSPNVVTAVTGVRGNGNFMPDCDLRNFAANGECGPIVNAGFGSPVAALVWDDKARHGWGVREYNYQWSVSLQHELRPGFGVAGGFYHTDYHNTQIQVNTALTASSFDRFCMTAPADPRLGVVSGQQVCGITNVNFASKAIAARTVQYRVEDAPIPGLTGRPTEVYNGGELSMNWRFRQSGLLSGGLALGKTVSDRCFANAFPQITSVASSAVGGAGALGLRDNNYCTDEAQSLWNGIGSQVKFQVVYPLPFDFVLAATYKHLPGIAVAGTVTYANAAVAPVLGRNLSACAAATGACTQTASVNVVRPGTLFDERLNQIDLRGTRRIRIGKARLQGVLELYNVLNSRRPESDTTTWGVVTSPTTSIPGTTYLRPSSFLGGRLFKFGAQVDF